MKNIKDKSKLNIPALAVIGIIILAVIISVIAVAASKGSRPDGLYQFNQSVANGIDVSEHNGEIDWEKVKETQDFAFIRVGYRGYGNGEIYEDKYAADNLKNANKAKIPVGVYFYTQAVTAKEAEDEADFVYDIIKKYNIDLPVMIDFEYPIDSDGNAVGRLVESDNDLNKNAEIINSFVEKLEKKGYTAGVYASSSVLHNKISMKKLKKSAVAWVADYNDKVTYDVDYTIWQYSETGSVDGVSSKYVDLNYWYE
ncbi:MAG: hypothetical protein HFJ97_08725 [Eubacterium sp.]|nr:hypothetical protein [Eubacterium sp.]